MHISKLICSIDTIDLIKFSTRERVRGLPKFCGKPIGIWGVGKVGKQNHFSHIIIYYPPENL